MSSSLILQRFSELLNNPEVLTHPQEFLGLHYKKVLEFWNRIENLSKEQLRVVEELYWAFYNENLWELRKARDLAWNASIEVVSEDYGFYAGWAAEDVTNSWAACWATREIIGGVTNSTFIPMFDNL